MKHERNRKEQKMDQNNHYGELEEKTPTQKAKEIMRRKPYEIKPKK